MVKIYVICAWILACLVLVDSVSNLVTNGQVSLINLLMPQFSRLDGDPIAFLLSRILRFGLCLRVVQRSAFANLVLCFHLIRGGRTLS